MQVAPGIDMLEISALIMGRSNTIYPTLIWDEQTAILADAGYPDQLPLFMEAFAEAGVPWERLAKVIMTHFDIDHVGSLPAIIKLSSQPVEVLSGTAEKPYIQGDLPSPKLTPEVVARFVDALPAEMDPEMKEAFRRALSHPPTAPVDRTLADGDVLPECGGIVAIATPGHTPGHTCYYHRKSKTLIAGDALRVEGGELLGPLPRATLDLALATESLKKLAAYEIEAVICYHGGLWRGDVKGRLAHLTSDGGIA